MKKTLLLITLITSFSAQALVIQGEESKKHFIQIKKIHNSEDYTILDCKGAPNDFKCEGLFPVPVPLSKDFVLDMSRDKMIDMGLAIGADVLILAIAAKAYSIAFYTSRFYYGAVKGLSVDGVGTASGIIALTTVTPTLAATPLIFDVLDPRTHYDLAEVLKASVSEVSSLELQNEYDGINMRGNFELHSMETELPTNQTLLEVDHLATINNLSTQDIINSFKKLIKAHVREQNLPYKDLILGDNETPVQKLLKKKIIGL